MLSTLHVCWIDVQCEIAVFICSINSIPWSEYHTIPYHTIAIPCSMESIPGIIGWKQRHFSCHCPHSHPNTQFTTQDLHAIANLRCDFAHPVVHLASAQRYLIVWPGRYWRCNIHPHCFDLARKNIYLKAGHIRLGGISDIREYHNQKGWG